MGKILGLLLMLFVLGGCATNFNVDGGNGGVRGGVSTSIPF